MLLARHQDPIAAVATAPGRGGIGIIRISGKNLKNLALELCGRIPVARHAHYLPFCSKNGDLIDRGIALFFPAPHSYTGEDVLELQIHGGQAVLQLLLQRCLEAALEPLKNPVAPGLRLAHPGEFTERAYLNGKMDLTQAEAVADLVDASTSTAARSAARSLAGEFSQAVHVMQVRLTQLRVLVEATLDFPEEEIDFLQKNDAQGQLLQLQQSVDNVLQRASQGSLLRNGVTVVLAGQPNTGKSALLNALAGAEIAIVSPVAGTTRDKVSQHISIEGVPLHIIDTAGLRQSVDSVEKIGIERAWMAIEEADVVLFLHDLSRCGDAENVDSENAINFIAADATISDLLAIKLPKSTPVIHVWNKVDLNPHAATAFVREDNSVSISAKTGAGLDNLRRQLLRAVGWQVVPEGVFMARERHIQAILGVKTALNQASEQLHRSQPALDLLSEDLRIAQLKLGEITGTLDSDALLGEIFAGFCIGK